jgi:hypothetical protein
MRIVFKRENAESPDLTFVEIEDDAGRCVQVGEWSDEGDGFHVLVVPDVPVAAPTLTDAEKARTDTTLIPNSGITVEQAGAYLFEAPPVAGSQRCKVNGQTALWSANWRMTGLLYLAAGDLVSWSVTQLYAPRHARLSMISRH